MKYNAFISYSNKEDTEIANFLHKRLHKIDKKWYQLRNKLEIFQDSNNFKATSSLWNETVKSLEESEYLIYLASPEAVKSKWVTREINWWCKNKDKKNIIIALTKGTIVWSDDISKFDINKSDCIPEILENIFEDEPLYLKFIEFKEKLRPIKKHEKEFDKEAVKIASVLLKKDKNKIISNELNEQNIKNKFLIIFIIIIIGILIFSTYNYFEADKQKNINEEAFASSILKRGAERKDKNVLSKHMLAYGMSKINNIEEFKLLGILFNNIYTGKLLSILSVKKNVKDSIISADKKNVLIVMDNEIKIIDVQNASIIKTIEKYNNGVSLDKNRFLLFYENNISIIESNKTKEIRLDSNIVKVLYHQGKILYLLENSDAYIIDAYNFNVLKKYSKIDIIMASSDSNIFIIGKKSLDLMIVDSDSLNLIGNIDITTIPSPLYSNNLGRFIFSDANNKYDKSVKDSDVMSLDMMIKDGGITPVDILSGVSFDEKRKYISLEWNNSCSILNIKTNELIGTLYDENYEPGYGYVESSYFSNNTAYCKLNSSKFKSDLLKWKKYSSFPEEPFTYQYKNINISVLRKSVSIKDGDYIYESISFPRGILGHDFDKKKAELLVYDTQGNINIYNVFNGVLINSFFHGNISIQNVFLYGDNIISINKSGEIRIWEKNNEKQVLYTNPKKIGLSSINVNQCNNELYLITKKTVSNIMKITNFLDNSKYKLSSSGISSDCKKAYISLNDINNKFKSKLIIVSIESKKIIYSKEFKGLAISAYFIENNSILVLASSVQNPMKIDLDNDNIDYLMNFTNPAIHVLKNKFIASSLNYKEKPKSVMGSEQLYVLINSDSLKIEARVNYHGQLTVSDDNEYIITINSSGLIDILSVDTGKIWETVDIGAHYFDGLVNIEMDDSHNYLVLQNSDFHSSDQATHSVGESYLTLYNLVTNKKFNLMMDDTILNFNFIKINGKKEILILESSGKITRWDIENQKKVWEIWQDKRVHIYDLKYINDIIIAKASQSIIIYDIYSGDKISEFSYPENNNDSLYGVTYHKHLDAIVGWSSHNIYMQPLHSRTSIDTACIVPKTQILTGTKLDPVTALLRTLPYDDWSKLQSRYSACLN